MAAPDGRPCRACGASMIWGKWPNGRGVPLDAEPSADGNIRLQRDGSAEILKGVQLAPARQRKERLFITHFATCPNADSFRKER